MDDFVAENELTLLFADIEGLSRAWDGAPAEMAGVVEAWHQTGRELVPGNGGVLFKTVGELLCCVFPDPVDAVRAAVALERAAAVEQWGRIGRLPARVAIHTGQPQARNNDYYGPPVNRVARLLYAGTGEQILVSEATATAVAGRLPEDIGFVDLGEHRLKDLLDPARVWQLTAQGLRTDFPPLHSLDRALHNLPVQATPLIGREPDVERVREALAGGSRLVTLTGPGGTGKTRLALQVAAEELERWLDGAWFVGLAPIADPALVVPTIAAILGVRESGIEPLEETLVAWLRERRLLLVLDNLERLLDAAPVLERLFESAPNVAMLVTSRAPLQIYGEVEYPVPPLAVPRYRRWPGVEAVRGVASVTLFDERARTADAGFALTEANGRAVADLCVRLEGLPLAIELAAARVGEHPPAEILASLSQRLVDLGDGDEARDPRQRTLRAAIGWSYELLPLDQQRLFRRLAVLAGGDLETIEQIAAPDGDIDPLDGIEGLVVHSLVRREDNADGARFAMLETIREFATQALAATPEESELRGRHADHFTGYSERAETELSGTDQAAWYGRLDRELDNIRGALGWLGDRDRGEQSIRLAGALWRFWWVRSYLTEGRRWIGQALAMTAGGDPLVRAKALDGYGVLLEALGEAGEAADAHRAALALARDVDDPSAIGRALDGLGILAMYREELATAEAFFREALDQRRKLGDPRLTSISLGQLAHVALRRADYDQAEALVNESLAISRQIEDVREVAINLAALAMLKWRQRDYGAAEDFYRESLAMQQELGDEVEIPNALVGLGRVMLKRGELDQAERYMQEALAMFEESGSRDGEAWARIHVGEVEHELGRVGAALSEYHRAFVIAEEIGYTLWMIEALEAIGNLLCGRGHAVEGLELLSSAAATRDTSGLQPGDTQIEDMEIAKAAALDTLSPAAYDDAWRLGATMTMRRALDEVEPLLESFGATLTRAAVT